MLKKSLIILLLVVIVLAGLAWLKRVDILLGLVKFRSDREFVVAPNTAVPWEKGPQEARSEAQQRLPNIILIVADDLGYNDISTFGGGVAGGRLQTPHIDQLAEQGAVFNQSYAGNATCAPSRAMIMTGRYPAPYWLRIHPYAIGHGSHGFDGQCGHG